MRFAALGRTRWMRDAIVQAVARGHDCALIATCKAAPEYDVREDDFKEMAQRLNAQFCFGASLSAPAPLAMLTACDAKAAISVNWLTLIPEEVRSIFPQGVWNAHAGDLPRYRGNACPNWAIINGERSVTLTIHAMADGLDAGDILLQSSMPLDDKTYVGDIYAWLNIEIPRLFANSLDALDKGDISPRAQPDDPAQSLRCFPRQPSDSMIDWTRPAVEVARLVRASAEPFAGAYTFLDGQRLVIWRAHAVSLGYPWSGIPGHVAERTEDGDIIILCGENALCASEVEVSGSGRLRPAMLIKSLRTRLGEGWLERIERLEAKIARAGPTLDDQ